MEHRRPDLPWIEADYLMLDGVVMADLDTADFDVEAFRAPYTQHLAHARTSPVGRTLALYRLRFDMETEHLQEQLERLVAMHVIRGRCELCSGE